MSLKWIGHHHHHHHHHHNRLTLSSTITQNVSACNHPQQLKITKQKQSLWSNVVSLGVAVSITLTTPLPSLAIPSLNSQSSSSATTPFSQAKNLPTGLENGKIRPCPAINPGCISTNPKSSSFAFPWKIPETTSLPNAVDQLRDAILKTQKNAKIEAVEDTPNGKYLEAEVDGGFGRDVMEFLVKDDTVAFRAMATKVNFVYPFTTAFGDSKGQEERVKKIVGRYAAKQLVKAYPEDVIVHCSDSNSNMLTFDGVDVMGNRLADEVISVIRRYPNLQKISFIGHSLGGVVSRYAIARLYEKEGSKKVSEENGECRLDGSNDSCLENESKGKIAGLEPLSFITSATPHLGSRGHKQVPMFCGFHTLEKVALNTSWLFGRTGKHLFLADSDDGKPPLLLRMANDMEDLKFISALRSFKRRVAYANVSFDQLVGWSTSSLRRRNELPKRRNLLPNDKYPHIVNIETAETSSVQDDISVEAKLKVGNRADMEEAMIRGLTKMSWERIDVNFKGSKQRYLAHSTIQVKTKYLNSDGADVIQHMVDNFLL